MYLDEPIAHFVHRWWEKCQKDSDPFDRFVSAWIVLVAIARANENHSGHESIDDSVMVRHLLQEHSDVVLTAMSEQSEFLRQLARRKGSEYRNAIVDCGNNRQRESNELFAAMVANGGVPTRDHLATLAWVLSRVRNNLFHGRKIYNQAEDAALLEIVTPIIMAIIRGLLEANK